MGRLARALFGLSVNEADFDVRGFERTDDSKRRRLEEVGRAFITGYHAQLAYRRPAELTPALTEVSDELRGFAVEGAAMAATILDAVWPWRRSRFAELLRHRDEYRYLIYVGVGWAWARLRLNPSRRLRALDPLLGWLAVDGYGFHEGYFHWQRYASGARSRALNGYQQRVFDQGLGRSMWFVFGAIPDKIAGAIRALEPGRHSDLWSGVGLAATYAGGASVEELGALVVLAGEHHAALAQGAAFGAAARAHGGMVPPHTETACQVLAARSAIDVATVTTETRRDLTDDVDTPAFEVWRNRIRTRISETRNATTLRPAASA